MPSPSPSPPSLTSDYYPRTTATRCLVTIHLLVSMSYTAVVLGLGMSHLVTKVTVDSPVSIDSPRHLRRPSHLRRGKVKATGTGMGMGMGMEMGMEMGSGDGIGNTIAVDMGLGVGDVDGDGNDDSDGPVVNRPHAAYSMPEYVHDEDE